MDDTVEFGPDYHLEPLRHVPVVNETFPPAEMDVSNDDTSRAVARAIIREEGVNIHIYVFCQTIFL